MVAAAVSDAEVRDAEEEDERDADSDDEDAEAEAELELELALEADELADEVIVMLMLAEVGVFGIELV